MPKFHDRKSLIFGAVAGFSIPIFAVLDMLTLWAYWWVVPMVVGMVLGVHCLDMLRYYKKHRVVRIKKADKERIVYKDKSLV